MLKQTSPRPIKIKPVVFTGAAVANTSTIPPTIQIVPMKNTSLGQFFLSFSP